MVKIALILALAGLAVYFGMVLFVAPYEFSNIRVLDPQPSVATTISADRIHLGDSFRLTVNSENSNDVADIQIVSIEFPNMTQIGSRVEIVGYDFTQSPRYVKTGDDVGSEYSGGTKSVVAQYPSIEAYSRPVSPGAHHYLELKITPDTLGNFTIFVKTVAIPHGNNSHYPRSGIMDHQNEYVVPISVAVSQ